MNAAWRAPGPGSGFRIPGSRYVTGPVAGSGSGSGDEVEEGGAVIVEGRTCD